MILVEATVVLEGHGAHGILPHKQLLARPSVSECPHGLFHPWLKAYILRKIQRLTVNSSPTHTFKPPKIRDRRDHAANLIARGCCMLPTHFSGLAIIRNHPIPFRLFVVDAGSDRTQNDAASRLHRALLQVCIASQVTLNHGIKNPIDQNERLFWKAVGNALQAKKTIRIQMPWAFHQEIA